MGTPRMVKDKAGREIQVLADDTAASMVDTITVGAASARVAIPAGALVVRLAATVNCYYKWGDNTVTAAAGDRIMIAGVEMKAVPEGVTHIAAIQVTTAGLLEIDAQI